MNSDFSASTAFSRRSVIRSLVGPALMSPMASMITAPKAAASDGCALDNHFDELDQKILQGMKDFVIPGVAVGVHCRGVDYLRGYGVTDINKPTPVDANTAFRIASVTKPFTGTTAMYLVERGWLDLDAQVTRYIDNFRTPVEGSGSRYDSC
jgi:CubicO group peptidase (beta-lactamase class C family)